MSESSNDPLVERRSDSSVANPSVVVKNVSKTYTLPSASSRKSLRRRGSKTVDALKNISFVARQGESIGIIGRNGSGKSTLLRLVGGGEAPSSGKIFVRHQPTLLGVAPALQSWLTGEQNIYLGCLALGMKPDEAKAAVPEIAEWAELGEAALRPMGTYSSGMSAKLSFAISTAVKPEVLLVDETLSTGDAAFAKKAQARMNELLERAGNLFLVSHSTSMIEGTCERGIWIHQGELIEDGDCGEVIADYRAFTNLLSDGKVDEANRLMQEVRSNNHEPWIELS